MAEAQPQFEAGVGAEKTVGTGAKQLSQSRDWEGWSRVDQSPNGFALLNE